MELLYCLIGFIIAAYIIPILDGISAWFLTWIELKKSILSELINRYNIKMRRNAESLEEDSPKFALGFQLPDEEENNEEGYEDDI